nr:reverse transcriptase domain-containing protein [Tanacetum cinerariifolium]
PLLAAPKPQEELIMYLSATHGAISAVLLTERGTAQTQVYFISRALQGPELNYSPMEKLVLSLVFAAKRLRRYFQAHPIAVITDQPIKQVMSRPDASGRLQKWSIMLGEHNITYRPRTSIKGQILADFLNEIPSNASQDKSAAGLILTNLEGVEFTYALSFQFAASNNEAEYEALIAGLQIATQMGVKNIQANVDSKLVANQVLGTYVAKEDNMIKYLEIAKGLVSRFKTFSISQVPWSKNKKVDALSKIAGVAFQPGDFVYRSNDASHAAAGGKLGPKWEGPYKVTDALGKGAYKLRSMDGTMLPRTWNVANLKRCYL